MSPSGFSRCVQVQRGQKWSKRKNKGNYDFGSTVLKSFDSLATREYNTSTVESRRGDGCSGDESGSEVGVDGRKIGVGCRVVRLAIWHRDIEFLRDSCDR